MANTYSATLNGSSQAFTAEDSASLDITGDISLEMWIKLGTGAVADIYTNDEGLCYKAINNADNLSWKWSLTAGSGSGKIKLQFAYTSDGSIGGTVTNGVDNADTFQTSDEGTWHHIAVTVDVSAATITFYLDGSARTTSYTVQNATSIFSGSAKVSLGASAQGTAIFFRGQIDEPRIWNVIRSGTEINNNKSVSIDSGTNLQASWHLNNALTDSSGNSNTLTNIGSATFTTDVPFVGAAGPAHLKTWNGIATANIKTINGKAIANVKTINGIT